MKTDSDELDRDIDNARRRSAAAQLAIAEKLETVEKQIRETVAGTQSAINDVVTNVKSTISDTTNSVKRTALSNSPASLAGVWQRCARRLFARRPQRQDWGQQEAWL